MTSYTRSGASKRTGEAPDGDIARKKTKRDIDLPPDELEELLKAARDSRRPAFKQETLSALLDPVYDESWSEADEQRLETSVDHEPIARALLDIRNSNPAIATLWKTTLCALHETPDRILAPPLAVDQQLNNELRRHHGMRNPNMNQRFCEALATLVCHPIWEGDYRPLQQAIGFLVACRNDDCRPWPFEESLDKFVMKNFCRLATCADGQTTMATLFRRAQRATGPALRGAFVYLLQHLAGEGDDDEEPHPVDDLLGHDPAEYIVSTKHLTTLIEALDTLAHNGQRLFRPALLYEQLANANRSQRHIPFGPAELARCRKRSILRERRILMMESAANARSRQLRPQSDMLAERAAIRATEEARIDRGASSVPSVAHDAGTAREASPLASVAEDGGFSQGASSAGFMADEFASLEESDMWLMEIEESIGRGSSDLAETIQRTPPLSSQTQQQTQTQAVGIEQLEEQEALPLEVSRVSSPAPTTPLEYQGGRPAAPEQLEEQEALPLEVSRAGSPMSYTALESQVDAGIEQLEEQEALPLEVSRAGSPAPCTPLERQDERPGESPNASCAAQRYERAVDFDFEVLLGGWGTDQQPRHP
ncbi:hypothetical protein ACHAQA_010036 [Verticillium albo-atrum]